MSSAPAIGVDVGGTAIKAVLVRRDGEVLARREVPTPQGAALLPAVAAVVAELDAESSRASQPLVGLSVPGIVDEERQLAVLSTNLGWRDAPLGLQLSELTGRPVVLGHDVRAGGRAELRWGAARDLASVHFIALGTGIASALILDGRPVVGGGWAGESGHTLVPDPDSGEPVLLERVASAAAIAARWTAATRRDNEGSITVLTAAADGDLAARSVLADAIRVLADVLAAQITLIGPVPIVIGGGLSRAGAALVDPLRAALDERLVLTGSPPLLLAELGSWSGALGSAAQVFDGTRFDATQEDPR